MCISARTASKKIISIPPEVQEEVEARVATFNAKQMEKYKEKFVPIFKGKYIYMMTIQPKQKKPWPLFRLTYQGDINDLDFAIFKYSSEQYDPEEFIFPGFEETDGTVEGGMRAGIKAYLDNQGDLNDIIKIGDMFIIEGPRG